VYVHVPFCASRCDYCAFATWTDRHHLIEDYVAACMAELARVDLPPATSVFFGGGTPSLLPAELLGAILAGVARAPNAEVTVECNPDTVTSSLLSSYRAAGVTRLSFGVQSMDPDVLGALGRQHDPAAVRRSVEAAAANGFADAYSVDLIYGGVGESVDSWKRTVQQILALEPAPRHVSAYALTVEPGTPLAADLARHPDPDDQATKYEIVDELLGDAGLAWYEISNWAAPGAECRHNQLYWDQGQYRGVGCAAHSHSVTPDRTARRWWNVRTPERYIRLIGEGSSPVAAGEELDSTTRRREALQLALRTRTGVPAAALEEDPAIEGLVKRTDGRAVLTLAGRLLTNEVALRLKG
jgi:putative oxygen-independent coproporphyrinogen III oxidase